MAMLNTRQHLALCGAVAGERVGDEHARHVRAALKPRAAALLGRVLSAPVLDQHTKDMPILIDGPPEIVLLALDVQKALIEVPCVTGLGPPATELVRILLAEPQTPLPPVS